MEEILTFAQNATPMIMLALALVIIVLLLLKNNKQPLVLKNLFGKKEGGTTLETIAQQLNVMASNHLHELPEMKRTLDRIEKKQQEQGDEQIEQGNRLSKVETAITYLKK